MATREHFENVRAVLGHSSTYVTFRVKFVEPHGLPTTFLVFLLYRLLFMLRRLFVKKSKVSVEERSRTLHGPGLAAQTVSQSVSIIKKQMSIEE